MQHCIDVRMLCGAAAIALASALPGQLVDPRERVLEIGRAVAEELREIDRLLLRSSERGAAGDESGAAGVGETLRATTESQRRVVEGIDELIAEISKLGGT